MVANFILSLLFYEKPFIFSSSLVARHGFTAVFYKHCINDCNWKGNEK